MGLDDRSRFAGTMVYPNPVSDMLHVQPAGSGLEVVWQMTDQLGRVVRSGAVGGMVPFTVDMASLAQGTYLVQLKIDGRSEVLRVVRN
jgi:hypothetical protein